MRIRQIIVSILCTLSTYAYECTEPEQLRIGNFALPYSQQPSSLYGFGQYVVEEGDLLLGMSPNFVVGRNFNLCTFTPYLLYGITDKLVVLVALPVAERWHAECSSSNGLTDGELEFEYLLYDHKTEISSWEVSLVGTLILPFGNDKKMPITGFGSPSFFAGVINRYFSTEWYWYISAGGIFTTLHNQTRFGDSFLYQTGFGKNVGYEPDKWICMVMFEMNGLCTQRDKICGTVVPDGGNFIGFGPTVWFSTQKFIFQVGCLPIVYQSWDSAEQPRLSFLLSLNFEWKL